MACFTISAKATVQRNCVSWVRRAIAVAAVSAAAAGNATSAAESADAAEPTYQLQYKFQRGEVLRYRVTHSTNVRTTIDAKTQQVESQTESTKVWKVTDVLPGGELEFVHMVEAIKMVNQTPGGKPNRYDSEQDKTPPPGFEQAARAVGVPLSVLRIRPDGEIVSREQKHPQPPATDDMPLTLQLPAEPVRIGDKWDRTYDVEAERKSGTKLQVRTRRVCKLAAVHDGVADIEVEYQVLSPIDAYVRSQLVERLTKGRVQFSLADGRVLSQTHDVDARILGFAGAASSMHFLARLEERILAEPQTARNAAPSAASR